MKKIIATGATVLMALLLAAPSFALETKVTGTFTLDGVLNLNPGLESDSDDQETVSYREMQLRLNTETKVTDKITFFTRVDILDKMLSSQFTNTVDDEDDDNIQFDHAWMRIISPVGVWQVGRKTGVKWGTDFFDDGNDYGTDRLEYILPIPVGDDKFIFGAVAEKALETQQTNRDNDKFYLTGTYMSKDWKTGLLLGLYSYNTFVADNGAITVDAEIDALNSAFIAFQANPLDPAAAAAAGAAALSFGAASDNYNPRIDGQVVYVAPYFSGKVGPLNINAEFGYINGEAQLKGPYPGLTTAVYQATFMGALGLGATPAQADAAGTAAANATQANTSVKKDVDAMCYWLEVAYPMDKANVEVGYAYLSGDKDGFSSDIEYAGFLGQGEDWEKLFILTGDDSGLDGTLGGDGNILQVGSAMNTAGMNLMYLGGSFDVTDTISLGGIFGMATADEAPAGWDDDYGMELDLSFTWKLMDNLEYTAIAAHLMAGDFWEGATGNTKVDDVTALYHQLVLSF
ncbi:hypothetical protein JCM14469_00330 [Desulfatiferula olefinivorans]